MAGTLRENNQNNQLMLWTDRISECRNSQMSVSDWCTQNGICKSTYYFWQRKIFNKLKEEKTCFADITNVQNCGNFQSPSISARLRIGEAELDVYSGADKETIKMLIQVLRSC